MILKIMRVHTSTEFMSTCINTKSANTEELLSFQYKAHAENRSCYATNIKHLQKIGVVMLPI